MKRKIFLSLITILVISYWLSAIPALAQINLDFLKGLVPCGTSYAPQSCTVCYFYKLIQNIINFLLFTSAPLATLMAIYIAFLFMLSGGSPAKITDAKSKLWLLVWGIFWVLASWLILNTILEVMVNKSVFPWPWNQIQCEVSQSSNVSGTEGTGNIPQPTIPDATLSEQEARSQFQQNGITINKNPCPSGVPYENVSGGCTSLDGIKTYTAEEVIQLKKDCGCALEITGGTELGHAGGVTSHVSGDKLDFKPNPALDQYIQNNFNYIGLRSDGAKQYRAPNGILMAKEGDHWDATFIKL